LIATAFTIETHKSWECLEIFWNLFIWNICWYCLFIYW